jgi:hypothetical protein
MLKIFNLGKIQNQIFLESYVRKISKNFLGLKKLFNFFVSSVLRNRIRDGKIQIRDWDGKIRIRNTI